MKTSRSPSGNPKPVALADALSALQCVWIDDIPFAVAHEDGKNPIHTSDPLMGRASLNQQTLWLCRDLPAETKLFVLLHEIVHGIVWSRIHGLPDKYLEAVCDGIAGGILSLIRQNPALLRALTIYAASAAPGTPDTP